MQKSCAVILHKAESKPEFCKILDNAGYTYNVMDLLPTAMTVNSSYEDFTLKDHPLVAKCSMHRAMGHMAVDTNQDNIVYTRTVQPNYSPANEDTWALARICRRKNPFNTPPWGTSAMASSHRSTRTGAGVTVFTIDTLVDMFAPELEGRAKDMVTGEPEHHAPPTSYDFYHGSATAACITGKTLGIAPSAKVVQKHITHQQLAEGAFASVLYEAGLEIVTRSDNGLLGPSVLSISIGGISPDYELENESNADDLLIRAVCEFVMNLGVPVVCAAGNAMENDDDEWFTSPASVTPDIISVGATSIDDALMYGTGVGSSPAFFPNFGTAVSSHVDIYAPGHNVKLLKEGTLFRVNSGTSFACPYTAGVIACMMEGNSRPTNIDHVRAISKKLIENSTRGLIDKRSRGQIMGGGTLIKRLNTMNATGPITGEHIILNDRLLYLDPNIEHESIEGLTKIGKVLPTPDALTLTGSGFEAITNPKPTSYDTFNDYTGVGDGQEIPTTNVNEYWEETVSLGTSPYVLDKAISLGRVYCIKSSGYKSSLKWPRERPDGPSKDSNKIYVTWAERFNQTMAVPPQVSGGSAELMQLWDTRAGNNSEVSYIPKSQGYVTYWNSTTGQATEAEKREVLSDVIMDDLDGVGRFHIHAIEIDSIAGTHTLYQDGKKVMTMLNRGKDPESIITDIWEVALIGFDPSNSTDYYDNGADLRHWLAEFYQQPNLARVELSNEPVYDDTVEQRRFYQLCTVRSDTQIEIPKAFYGDLDQASPIYAHIIKTDGSVIDYGRIN